MYAAIMLSLSFAKHNSKKAKNKTKHLHENILQMVIVFSAEDPLWWDVLHVSHIKSITDEHNFRQLEMVGAV